MPAGGGWSPTMTCVTTPTVMPACRWLTSSEAIMAKQSSNRALHGAFVISGALLLSVPAQAQQVGTAAGVSPAATSQNGQAAARQVRLGDHVLRNQRFVTDAHGVVQVLLADGSSFTI